MPTSIPVMSRRLIDALTARIERRTANPEELVYAIGAGLPRAAIAWGIDAAAESDERVLELLGPSVAALLGPYTARSLELSTLRLLVMLAGSEPTGQTSREESQLPQLMARTGLAYSDFITGLRAVRELTLERLLTTATSLGIDEINILALHLTSIVARHFDAVLSRFVDEYLAERERLLSHSLTDRHAAATALVTGEAESAAAASKSLGIDLNHYHLCVILWEASDVGNGSSLAAIARRLAITLQTMEPVTLPDPTQPATLLCWLSRPTPPRPERLAKTHSLLEEYPAVRAAIGVAAHGAGGFRRSTLAARDTETFLRAHDAPGATMHASISALALLSADPARAAWFVQDELGDLGSQPGRSAADLRTTALTFLASGQNLAVTARALHIHRSTVIYRLQKADQLVGRPLTQRPLEVHMALTLAIHGIDLYES